MKIRQKTILEEYVTNKVKTTDQIIKAVINYGNSENVCKKALKHYLMDAGSYKFIQYYLSSINNPNYCLKENFFAELKVM